MPQHLFKYKHFESEIILLCVRWCLKYPELQNACGDDARKRIEDKPYNDYEMGSYLHIAIAFCIK